MRRLITVLGLVLVLTLPIGCPVRAGQFDVQTDTPWTFKVWCRHDALYWGGIVGEVREVRMVLGWYESKWMKGWHVQPQVKVNGNWHFFQAHEVWDEEEQQVNLEVEFISMPKNPGDKWRMAYTLTYAQFALMHNSWILYDKDRAYNTQRSWNEEMNKMMARLKMLEEKYRAESESR